MRRKKIILDAEDVQINLTPLIDVVFVVLIMFIIIAPMLELDRVQLSNAAEHQNKESPTVKESSPVTIHVHADNTISFNSKRILQEQLLPLLKEAKRKNPNGIPQLYHDKKAYFGTYQEVKNAVEVSGFQELDVILQPP